MPSNSGGIRAAPTVASWKPRALGPPLTRRWSPPSSGWAPPPARAMLKRKSKPARRSQSACRCRSGCGSRPPPRCSPGFPARICRRPWRPRSPRPSSPISELALPGGDPRRRAHALLDLGDDVVDDSSSVRAALAGYNQLAYGDAVAALESFRRVVEVHPEELLGWEGLRSAAEAVGDRASLAEACAALGDAVSQASEGSEFWEQAALILLDELGDAARGEYALTRAVERDVRRFSAFDRLFPPGSPTQRFTSPARPSGPPPGGRRRSRRDCQAVLGTRASPPRFWRS